MDVVARSGKRCLEHCKGSLGAVATAHPVATAIGVDILSQGGNAVDAAVAAQAALCVLLPNASGLGGDGLSIVRSAEGKFTTYLGAGKSSAAHPRDISAPGATVTVPGVVDAWEQLARRHGRMPLKMLLAPSIRLARDGIVIERQLLRAVDEQRERLCRGSTDRWQLCNMNDGDVFRQPLLSSVLEAIGNDGADAFYQGSLAHAIAAAAREAGGAMEVEDLEQHRTVVSEPLDLDWQGLVVRTMPPPSQAILLLLALQWLDLVQPTRTVDSVHTMIEVLKNAFELRERAREGKALLQLHAPAVDPARASKLPGARPYLHTAGVATSDVRGNVVSSLVSLFDDFGSAVYVPEGGFVLNDRAEGFTGPPNEWTTSKRPIHTLSPVIVETLKGPFALATPGADGQIQTLLQVLVALQNEGELDDAISRPRWRSENGYLMVEASFPTLDGLSRLGHNLRAIPDGDDRFGAVVSAGLENGEPFAVADHRRQATARSA